MNQEKIEKINNFLCKNVTKLLLPFGFNRLTYKIFSFFYGLGYKYSFGSIRLTEDVDKSFYMEFMPWYFGNKSKVKDNSYNKVMLYGAEDYLKMIDFFEKYKLSRLIKSHSNKEIAFLIHRKLGFKFKKYKDEKDAKSLVDLKIFELYIYTDDAIKYKDKIKIYISTLKKFENRN